MASPVEPGAELMHLQAHPRKRLAMLSCSIASAHRWVCLHVAPSMSHSQAANEEKIIPEPGGALSPLGSPALLPGKELMHLLQSFPNPSYRLTSVFSPIHVSRTRLGEYLEKLCQKPCAYLDT